MIYKINLINSDKFVLLDGEIYEKLLDDEYLVKIHFFDNLRLHSSGCSVFQKSWRTSTGSYKVETIYPHRLIAERFLKNNNVSNTLVGAKNGNKLDCRLANLEWRNRSRASRFRKVNNESGYKGVYKEREKFRAIIYLQGKAVHIGMFKTAEEAARAYNEIAFEKLGSNAKLNKIRKR
ncbi:AP2/ERF family transcription factor [Membranihabitans marinus]|uniref:AP2 domain-containing protein n=1 Tax=Membranihabitans marinus TaxID=1227546 RepID=UPI001F4631C7|nr:AP2 domain-containing protein [Membranihabitans marinus]